MKTASIGMQNFLANPPDNFWYADIFTVTLVGGTILRFTNADRDIVFGGNTYYCGPILMERTNIRWATGLEVETLSLTLKARTDDSVLGNLLSNPGFEQGAAFWVPSFAAGSVSFVKNPDNSWAGDSYLESYSPGNNFVECFAGDIHGALHFFPVAAGQNVRFGGRINIVSGSPVSGARFIVGWVDSTGTAFAFTGALIGALGAWQLADATAVAPAGTVAMEFTCEITNAVASPMIARFDSAFLEIGNNQPTFIFPDLLAGKWDDASISIDRLIMPTPGDTSLGSINLFMGNVADITDLGRSAAKIEVKSKLHKLTIPMPRNLYQPSCRWTLYDTGCGLVKASFGVAASVQAGADSLTQIITALTQADAYFDLGTISFTSGANNGVTRTVRSYARTPSGVTLVTNGDGETGTVGVQATGWTLDSGSGLLIANDFAKFGLHSLKIINGTAIDSFSHQDISVIDQIIYRVGAWIKTTAMPSADAGKGAYVNIDIVSGVTSFTIIQKAGIGADQAPTQPDVGIAADDGVHDFTYVFCIFKVNGTGVIRLFSQLGYGGGQSGTAWFDQVTVEAFVPSVQLYRALQQVPLVGDTFTIFPGCDKLQLTCLNKFSNLANFSAEPYVPLPETAA